jgi:transcriptional regulator with XRE-family HTH domain
MTLDDGADTLGAFLQASRSRITPQEAGLILYGDRRRVSGLRREELAMLAGVSSSYYARLEQGQSRNASPQVLDAIASALHLNDAERLHLRRLGERSNRRPQPERTVREAADPALAQLLESIGDLPALVLTRLDMHFLPGISTLTRRRASRPDRIWPRWFSSTPILGSCMSTGVPRAALSSAIAVVGNLRLAVGLHPDDPALASLVGSLSIASATFGSLWADQRVQACATAEYEIHHPLVGSLTVTQQTLRSVDHPDQTLVTHTAPKGSVSAEALQLLAQLVGNQREDPTLGGRAEHAANVAPLEGGRLQ